MHTHTIRRSTGFAGRVAMPVLAAARRLMGHGGAAFVLGAACLAGWTAPAAAFGDRGSESAFGGLTGIHAGGMVLVAPKYEGSDDYRVIGVPLAMPDFGNNTGSFGSRIQFRGPDDVRFRLIDQYGFEAGPVAGYRFGRDEDDSETLRGLGDVDGSIVLGGFAAYRFGALRAFASYRHGVGGDDTGGLLSFGAETQFNMGLFQNFRLAVGANYADDDYMDAYFGISSDQSMRSGLAAYDVDAGIKDVYVGFSSDVPLSEDWVVKLTGRYSQLVGDAADSPIVESEGQFMGGVGLLYRFSLR